jgi:hypothetical protein
MFIFHVWLRLVLALSFSLYKLGTDNKENIASNTSSIAACVSVATILVYPAFTAQ